MSNRIGTLAETSLHADLKRWIGRSGDKFEVMVDGYFIDIVRGSQLIEVQTGNFGSMKRKLTQLLEDHPVLLLHPVAAEKWIVRETAVGEPISRRKSPKHGQILDIFRELIRLPHLLPHPNLRVGVLLVQQEDVLRDDGQGSWRRRHWSMHDRRLLAVQSQHIFAEIEDWLTLLPPQLERPFSNKQLAHALGINNNLAQRMTYTLRHCGGLSVVDKDGNALLYDISHG